MNDLESLELKISKFLRLGVLASAFLFFLGFILQFKLEGNVFYVFDTYDRIPFLNQVLFNLYHRNWGSLSSLLGLLTLISLPIIRVLLTAILFLKKKEHLMASMAIAVLIGLIISFSFGIEL